MTSALPTSPDHGQDVHPAPHKELTITICSADDDREFTFPRTTKIGEVIATAVKAFGLDPNDAYDLFLPKRPTGGQGGNGGCAHQNQPLDKDRTLGSYHEIHDGAELILTSRGGGV
jgi:hypothetical protein